MNHFKFWVVTIFTSVVLLFTASAAVGQVAMAQHQPAQNEFKQITLESNYEVTLQLWMGSNGGIQSAKMPASLSAIAQQAKTNYGSSNLALAETFLGRISNTGNFTYKGISNLIEETEANKPQSFLEWSVLDLKSGLTTQGSNGFQLGSFTFGARIPVPAIFEDKDGHKKPVVNYEHIGLTFRRVGVQENVPTLIGTLKLPDPNATIFLVMTVRSINL